MEKCCASFNGPERCEKMQILNIILYQKNEIQVTAAQHVAFILKVCLIIHLLQFLNWHDIEVENMYCTSTLFTSYIHE